MSPTLSYSTLISELDRDVKRILPVDPLLFCSKWFTNRLELEREQLLHQSSSTSTSSNALGFHTMGKSNFKRSFDGFTLSSTSTSNEGAPSTFDSRKRRMGIHGEPMDVEELSSISPGTSSRATFENNRSPSSSVSSSNKKSFSIPNIPLPTLSTGFRRASNASIASHASKKRRDSIRLSHPTPPLSPSNTSDSDSDVDIFSTQSNTKYNPVTGIPLGYKLNRRTSVSSESLNPTSSNSNSTKINVPKSPKSRARIELSIPKNLLFRNLSDDQLDDVFNAMEEVKIKSGVEVIVQGTIGDYFYICESGTLDVVVRSASTYTYVSPGQSTTTKGESSTVATYGPGGSFGELGLMYNAPRAATIIATTPCTLWRLDRITFRSILLEHTCRKRKMYEGFLIELPVMMGLKPIERTKIADALEEKIFEQGKEVVTEGLNDKSLYIIESGKAEVSRKRVGGEDEVLGNLEKGDSFGGLASIDTSVRASGRLRVATVPEEAIARLLGDDIFK